jgi:hypothetical protein
MATVGNRKENYSPNNDYYTPKWVFEKLNLHFDIDVCAPTGGVPWIPSNFWFDEEMDGLKQDWQGIVWCNPPYSKPAPFIDKLIAHGEGIMLTQISRSNGFIKLWNSAQSIVMLPRDMKFEHKTEGTKQIFMPTALFAFGHTASQALINAEINKVR